MIKGKIELTGMRFHAYHGCLEKERREGNEFVVDFRCSYDVEAAAKTDDLFYTADYGIVYDVIAKEMKSASNLLENVAYRIVNAISDRLPQIDSFEVKVSKKNPPVAGEAEWSSVTLNYER